MATSSNSSTWKNTIEELDASHQLQNPFFKRKGWPGKGLAEIPKQIETRIRSNQFKSDCRNKTRIFYLERYFEYALKVLPESKKFKINNCEHWIQRLLTRVPLVFVSSGEFQNGITFNSWKDKTFKKGCAQYKLLTPEERVLSRRKVIATQCEIYARGGYPRDTNGKVYILPESQKCIMLSVLGAQLDVPDLDITYFIEENDDGTQVVNQRLLLLSTIHDVYLWLTSFNEMLKLNNDGNQGVLKFSRVGCGFFALLYPNKTDLGYLIEQHLVWALRFVTEHCRFDHIAAIQCLFFNKSMFTDWFGKSASKNINGIKISLANRDILDIEPSITKKYTVGILNASDSFSVVGNEFPYASLEAYLGNNTSMRADQVYHWNHHLLDSSNYVGITIPKSVLGSSIYACALALESAPKMPSRLENYVEQCLDIEDDDEEEVEESDDDDEEEVEESDDDDDEEVEESDEEDDTEEAETPQLSDELFAIFGKGKWLQGKITNQYGFWSIAVPNSIQKHKSDIVKSVISSVKGSNGFDLFEVEKSAFMKSQWYKKKGFKSFKFLASPNNLLHIAYKNGRVIGEGKPIQFRLVSPHIQYHAGSSEHNWVPSGMDPSIIHIVWMILKAEVKGVSGIHDIHIAAYDAVKNG